MRSQRCAPFLLLVGTLISPILAEEDKACTTHSNGKYYDLNVLRSKEDYEVKTFGGQRLFLNVCGDLHSDTIGLEDAEKPAGFVRGGHRDFSIGTINQTLSLTESGARLTFTGGSRCKTSSDEIVEKMRASTVIDFICDMTAFGTGKPHLLAQLPPNDDNGACGFYFEWKTHYACPTSGSSAWGFFTVLAVVALVLVFTYTILGTLYNRYVLQLRGFDQIPQFSLESMRYHGREAIDWFRDVMGNMYESGQRTGSRNDDPPFIRPGGRSPDAPNPLSHHTQTSNEFEFVRPATGRAIPRRTHDINPVSHQAQIQNAASPPSQTLSSPPPPPPQKEARKLDKDIVQGSTPEEKQFMLSDEDDDAGQELVSVGTSSQPPSVAAQSDAHGRDLGSGNVL